jgi:hypothetical protein
MKLLLSCSLQQTSLGNQIKEDKMGWACSTHAEMKNAYYIWFEILTGGDNSENSGVHGRTALKLIIRKGCGLDLSGSGQGLVASACEHSNAPLGSIKGSKFLD